MKTGLLLDLLDNSVEPEVCVVSQVLQNTMDVYDIRTRSPSTVAHDPR